MSFSIFDKEQKCLPISIDKKVNGKDYLYWGVDNNYPTYLYDLYLRSSVFQSVIDGVSEYIAGTDVQIIDAPIFKDYINRNDETMFDIIKYCAKDLQLYNGFALQVIYNKLGYISEIYWLDLRKIRTNEERTKFYYCKDWKKAREIIEYNAFDANVRSGNQIFFYNGHSRNVYPVPTYSAAIRAIETSAEISNYHYNNIKNRFAADTIINFNNGQPTDEVKDDIERRIKEKFTGTDNSGNILISWNDNKENATTVSKLIDNNSDKKYESLRSDTYKEIFISMRCLPQLFGWLVEGSLFNKDEYKEAYELFYKTVVLPKQNEIIKCFNKIFNVDNSILIIPFEIYADEIKNNIV